MASPKLMENTDKFKKQNKKHLGEKKKAFFC